MGSNKTEMMNCLLEFSYHSSLLNVISPSLWHTDSNKNMAWRSPADKTRWASEYFWFTRWWGTAVSSCCFFHVLNSITWMMVVAFFFGFFWIYLISYVTFLIEKPSSIWHEPIIAWRVYMPTMSFAAFFNCGSLIHMFLKWIFVRIS